MCEPTLHDVVHPNSCDAAHITIDAETIQQHTVIEGYIELNGIVLICFTRYILGKTPSADTQSKRLRLIELYLSQSLDRSAPL